MANFSLIRCGSVIGIIVTLFVALTGRVAYLQTYGREASIARADRQQHQSLILPARRGPIYDRNGLLIAGTVETRSLFIDPKFMQECFQEDGHSLIEMDAALGKLARIIDQDPYHLSQLLGDRSTSRFIKIADNLDETTIAQIESLEMPGPLHKPLAGIGISTSSARRYPMGSLAAHILGGCGADGAGLDGLEKKFNTLLAGRPGFERETKDASRRAIGVNSDDYLPAQHGQHLVLTLDANLQMLAEQQLREAVEHFKAKRGEFVVMDPRTGDILALANYPTFDPQNVNEAKPDVRRNSALVAPYEPGSAFKPFIASPALMWHVTSPGEVWTIPAITWMTPYGRKIEDDDYHGNLSTWDGLVRSSNIVMSQMAERLGNPRVYQAITSFGFGQRTGIDLPGEDAGRVNPLKKWTHLSTESVAQGYEVLVTPLQLARAFCAIANGGHLVTPHVILGTVDPIGNVLSRQTPPELDSRSQVIDADTASQMLRILCDVVIRGTAKGNRNATWNIAGKTGTAHISEGRGGYSQSKFNSTFMCTAPAEDPRLVVVCSIHEADKSIGHFGAEVAAPAACEFIDRALTYMQVPASPDLPVPPPQVASVLYNYSEKQLANRNFSVPKGN